MNTYTFPFRNLEIEIGYTFDGHDVLIEEAFIDSQDATDAVKDTFLKVNGEMIALTDLIIEHINAGILFRNEHALTRSAMGVQ